MRTAIIGTGALARALGEHLAAAGREPIRAHARPGDPSAADAVREATCLLVEASRSLLEERLAAAPPGPGHRVVLLGSEVGPRPVRELIEQTACVRVGVLAGPLDPEDLSAGRPAAAVVASPFAELRRHVQDLLHCPRLRVYPSADLAGTALAAAGARLLLLAVGVADGLGLGPGTRAVVIARGLAELIRLAELRGGEPTTPAGLAGLGSVVARLDDPDAPERRLGQRLAGGGPGDPDLARLAADLLDRDAGCAPLVAQVQALLEGGVSAGEAMGALLEREAPGREV